MDLETLLFRLLSEDFKNLDESTFRAKYEDEVGDLSSDIGTEAFKAVNAVDSILRLAGGLIVLRSRNKWSLYETEQRVLERDHIKNWAEFARAGWTEKTPEEPGMYPVRSLDGRLGYHELRRVKGRLVDISGGIVPAGQVTNWRGQWWGMPFPRFPGAW